MISLFKSNTPPDGFFVDGMIVYGSLEKGSIVSKGFKILPPCLRSASVNDRNVYHEKLRLLLQSFGEKESFQVQWACSSDYKKELLEYKNNTDNCKHLHIKKIRDEKFNYFWNKMEGRELRKEELVFFITKQIDSYSGNLKTKKGLEEYYARVVDQLKTYFLEKEQLLRMILGADSGVVPFDDLGHFKYIKRFLNPSIDLESHYDAEKIFRPEKSIQENCMNCEGVTVNKGFYTDGYYHDIFSISRWPSRTVQGLIYQLTGLSFLDYRITLNVYPTDIRNEVDKEEKALGRIQGEYSSDASKRSHLGAINKKEQKIDALTSGYIHPFESELIIRVWDETEVGLHAKSAAIKQAVNSMNGAQIFECAIPVSAKKMFFNTWPGYRGDQYKHRRLYSEDTYLADMIPFSSTFTGKLDGAEAIYDGNQGNLVGLKTFEKDTPQHTVLFGMSGAGKSFYMKDILEQTQALYDYTVIIEEGLSYEQYTKEMGGTPIIVQPDSELTINYFDTLGYPLTIEQRNSAVTLVSKMIGHLEDKSKHQLRQAQLMFYIDQAYRDNFDSWLLRNQDKVSLIQRMACGVWNWKIQKMTQQSTFLEAYSNLNELIQLNNDEAQNFLSGISDEEINKFIKNPETESVYLNVGYAYFKPEEFPQHYQLVELMRYAPASNHDKRQIHDLATLLDSWTSSGQYGRIFDGVTNVSLEGLVAHFELGYINENAIELKTACALLITGFVRQHIISMPRKLKKRIIFEEVARFLDVPGGEDLVREAYAQLRKFSCCATSIVQQYSKFKNSSIRPVIMGNSKQYWIMKQMDRTDLEDMSKDIGLSETIMDGIQQYPLPEYLPENNKYSSICYYSPVSRPPLCGTMRNVKLNTKDTVHNNEININI